MRLVPIRLKDAQRFVREHHRHHTPPQGWRWGVGLMDAEHLVGVAMAGRPVSRMLDDGLTLEVTRCCTDGTRNAASCLYGAVRRAAKALGYRRLVTYTMQGETGASLRAAGWVRDGDRRGESWSRPSRPRSVGRTGQAAGVQEAMDLGMAADPNPTVPKVRWMIDL